MVTKPVQLGSGINFAKAGDANEHFRVILNGGDLREYLVGEERDAVDALYRDYCAATNYLMPAEPEQYFRDWNRAEDRTTMSFYVEYDNGEIDDFSYLKAVKSVANWVR